MVNLGQVVLWLFDIICVHFLLLRLCVYRFSDSDWETNSRGTIYKFYRGVTYLSTKSQSVEQFNEDSS